MNLKQLEVFLAVAETGSFTRGAEKSFLTQSTVSQHISSLENEFGIPLLDRTGKGVMLTEAGSILFYHASKILAGTHELANAMQRFKGMEKVVLRIGASNIPGTYLIPLFLPRAGVGSGPCGRPPVRRPFWTFPGLARTPASRGGL